MILSVPVWVGQEVELGYNSQGLPLRDFLQLAPYFQGPTSSQHNGTAGVQLFTVPASALGYKELKMENCRDVLVHYTSFLDESLHLL